MPEDLQRQEGTLQEILRTHGKGSGEFQITRCDNGERRHIQAVETVRLNAQGEAEWIVGTNLDITERKRAEAANQAKDEFLSALSHELRTPLKPVMMAFRTRCCGKIWK